MMTKKNSNTSLVSTMRDENNVNSLAVYVINTHEKMQAIERALIKETSKLTSQQLDILSIIYEQQPCEMRSIISFFGCTRSN